MKGACSERGGEGYIQRWWGNTYMRDRRYIWHWWGERIMAMVAMGSDEGKGGIGGIG